MERWRDVIGFENYYQISDCGRVRSKDRFIRIRGNGRALKKGKILSCEIGKARYKSVLFTVNKKEKRFSIHRLVGLHFVKGKTNIKKCINHKDCNKLNNHYTNLEWCSIKENNIHAHKYGLFNTPYGEKHPLAKISDKQVQEIISRKRKGVSTILLMRDYNISRSSISRICTGKQRNVFRDKRC